MVRKFSITQKQMDVIAERAELYSVALAFCKDETQPENYIPASGVLFEIGGRYFIFTAGHVARLVESYGDPFLSVARYFHQFKPKVMNYAFRYDENDDRGFIEVAPSDARIMLNRNKVFASLNRIHERVEIGRNSRVLIFGFPVHYANQYNMPFQFISVLLGKMRPKGIRSFDKDHLDLRIDRDAMGFVKNGQVDLKPQENLGGASGSGIWTFSLKDNTEVNIKLIGIANYHSQENWNPGSQNIGFIRAIKIYRVLDLVKEKYPDICIRPDSSRQTGKSQRKKELR